MDVASAEIKDGMYATFKDFENNSYEQLYHIIYNFTYNNPFKAIMFYDATTNNDSATNYSILEFLLNNTFYLKE